MTVQSTREPSQRLRKQSAVMTIEAATTLWPSGGLCLEEVCHTDVKIAYAVCGPVHQNVAPEGGGRCGVKSPIYDRCDLFI